MVSLSDPCPLKFRKITVLEKGNWGLDSEERVLDTGQAKNNVPLLFPLSSLLSSGLLTTFLQEMSFIINQI